MMKRHANLMAILAIALVPANLLAAGQSTEWALKMFDETEHNFGVVARGSDVQHRLKVTNIYEETVHIADVRTSCGCTAAKPSQSTLESLETAYIEIVMDTKKFTRQKDSSVIITIDAPQRAEVRIPISAYIRTDVVTDPGSVNFGTVDQGAGATREINVSYAGRADWKIVGVENLPEYMVAKLDEISRTSGGVNYKLAVTLSDETPVGAFRGQINLMTDDASNPRVPLLVEGDVKPDIVVSPEVVSLGMLTPGQQKTMNVVVRGKKPFKISKIECESDHNAFQVRLPQDEKTVHVVPLTISTPEGNGTLVEQFTITIDGRPEPVTFKALCKVVAGS